MSNENKLTEYFKGVRREWGKITWPEKDRVKGETFIVLLIVVFFTCVILFYDVIFDFVFGAIGNIK